MESLDKILSGSEPAPATETTQDTTTQPETVEQPTEQTTEAEGEPSKDGKPPIGAIRQAEREKATKRYTEQVADFEKKLNDQNSAWERRFGQLLETVKPKAEPKPVPDIFENASGAILHTVEPHFAELRQTNVHNSRLIAEVRHTEETVNAAEAAFSRAYQAGQVDPADAHKVLGSPNLYDAAVKWHKRTLAQQEIGDDPAAFKAKVEADIRAKLEAEHTQPETVTTNGQRPPVMPSNLTTARNVGARSGPAWAGPTPLGDIFKR